MNEYQTILEKLGVETHKDGTLEVTTPINGATLGTVKTHSINDVDDIARKSQIAFKQWRALPAPARGEFVRLLGEELRLAKDDLGKLVTIECGKIYSEGLGEVQEMIDICDYAVGLSRQL